MAMTPSSSPTHAWSAGTPTTTATSMTRASTAASHRRPPRPSARAMSARAPPERRRARRTRAAPASRARATRARTPPPPRPMRARRSTRSTRRTGAMRPGRPGERAMTKETKTMTTTLITATHRPTRVRRVALLGGFAAAACLMLGAFGAAPALADYGIASFDGSTLQQNGDPDTQAGSHPFEVTTDFRVTSAFDGSGFEWPTENTKDVTVDLPPGLVGNPQAYPTCSEADLEENALTGGNCP